MRRKCSILLITLLMVLGLTACGTPLYKMTDSESDVIATYCANTVAKYNRFQNDGMVFVINKTTAEQQEYLGIRNAETAENIETAEEDTEETEDITDLDNETENASEASSDENVELSEVPIGEFLGYPELSIYCDNMYSAPEYQEGNYILLTPDQGNAYLVMEISIKNPSEKPVNCDFMEKSPKFVIELSDGSRVETEGTILIDDFSVFKETVNAHGSAYAVALAQAPEGKLSDLSKVKVYLQAGGASIELPLTE